MGKGTGRKWELRVIAAVRAAITKGAAPRWNTFEHFNVKFIGEGGGGSLTWKVTVPASTESQLTTVQPTQVDDDAQPLALAVHLRPKATVSSDALCIEREIAAATFLSDSNMAPKAISADADSEGDMWIIEQWEGVALGANQFGQKGRQGAWVHPSVTPAQYGEALALLHKLPTDWFGGIREKLCAKTPALAMVPPSSHVWCYTCREEVLQQLQAQPSDFFRTHYLDTDVMQWMRSPASRRVVTTHNDFHPANLVLCPDGKIKCIDLEFVTVCAAVYDLGGGPGPCGMLFDENYDSRREYTAAYLRTMGDPSGDAEVEELMFDVEVASLWVKLRCGHHIPGFLPGYSALRSGRYKRDVEQLWSAMQAVRDDPEARRAFLSAGGVKVLWRQRKNPVFKGLLGGMLRFDGVNGHGGSIVCCNCLHTKSF